MSGNTNVDKEITNILDCFGGVDGGASFIKLKALLERFKEDDSESAREVELVVKRFSRLIDVVAST